MAPPLSDVLAHFILPAVPACLPPLNTTRTLLRIEMHLALTLADLSNPSTRIQRLLASSGTQRDFSNVPFAKFPAIFISLSEDNLAQ